MKAKEMFEELGYSRRYYDGQNIIFYSRVNEYCDFEEITFFDVTQFVRIRTYKGEDKSIREIKTRLGQEEKRAIRQQCKELGWI